MEVQRRIGQTIGMGGDPKSDLEGIHGIEGYSDRYGVVTWVSMKVEDFVAQAPQLFKRAPVRQLLLEGSGSPLDIDALTTSLSHGLIDSLCFYEVPLRSEEISSLFSSVGFQHVRRLRFANCKIDADVAHEIAQSPSAPQLIRLELPYNLIGDRGARSLAESTCLNRVERLDLERNGIGPDGARALAQSSVLATVRDLSLSCNPLGDDGVRSLAPSPWLHECRVLGLSCAGMTTVGAEALRTAASLDQLELLGLSGNWIYEGDNTHVGGRLFSSSSLPKLRVIFPGLVKQGAGFSEE